MNETVECAVCTREGKVFLEHGVVVHPGDQICELPPRRENPRVRVDRYRSPYAGGYRWLTFGER